MFHNNRFPYGYPRWAIDQHNAEMVGSIIGSTVGIIVIGMILFVVAAVLFYIFLFLLPIVLLILLNIHFHKKPLKISNTKKSILIVLAVIGIIAYYGVAINMSGMISSTHQPVSQIQGVRKEHFSQNTIDPLFNNVCSSLSAELQGTNPKAKLSTYFVNGQNNPSCQQLNNWAKNKYESTVKGSGYTKMPDSSIYPNIESISHRNNSSYVINYNITDSKYHKLFNGKAIVQQSNNNWKILSISIN